MHAHTEANKMLKNHPQTLYGTILLADQYCLLKCRKLVVPSDCPWSPVIYEGGHGLGFRYKLMVSMQG